MEIATKIKGWKFLNDEQGVETHFDFDGSESLDELRAEINKHEARLAEIPGLIVKNQNIINQKKQDAAFVLGLGWIKRRKWEKQNGKTVEAAASALNAQASELEGVIASLKTEQRRLPERIDSIKSQVNTLVKAEGKGIEKGIDPESAKQLGEIEVAKQQQVLEHERQLIQKQAETQKETDEKEADEKEKKAKKEAQTKWLIIGGVSLLVIIGIVAAIKKFKAKKLKALAT